MSYDQKTSAIEVFGSSVRGAHHYASSMGCAVYDKVVADFDWLFREYLPSRHDITIFDEVEGLPDGTLGAVFKESCRVGDRRRHVFIIVLSAANRDPVLKRVTLGHELAHVLLHGRLLEPEQAASYTSDPWTQQDALKQKMEMEANVFSLISFIPTPIIDAVREVICESQVGAVSGGGELRGCIAQKSPARFPVRALRQVVTQVYGGAFVAPSIIRERLVVDLALRGERFENEFRRYIEKPFQSWIRSGPDSARARGQRAVQGGDREDGSMRFSTRQIARVVASLTNAGVIRVSGRAEKLRREMVSAKGV